MLYILQQLVFPKPRHDTHVQNPVKWIINKAKHTIKGFKVLSGLILRCWNFQRTPSLVDKNSCQLINLCAVGKRWKSLRTPSLSPHQRPFYTPQANTRTSHRNRHSMRYPWAIFMASTTMKFLPNRRVNFEGFQHIPRNPSYFRPFDKNQANYPILISLL